MRIITSILGIIILLEVAVLLGCGLVMVIKEVREEIAIEKVIKRL